MVTISIEAKPRELQQALAYATVLLRGRSDEVQSQARSAESVRYGEELIAALRVVSALHEASYGVPSDAGHSLTPKGDDALDRELRRRDEIAAGRA